MPRNASRSNRPFLVVAVATMVAGACTTVAYPGPRRPSADVATIEARDFEVDSLDGADMRQAHRTLEVLPGTHRLGVRLRTTRDYYVMRVTFHAKPIELCVNALRGHYYILAATAGWARYTPVILDGASDAPVPACDLSGDE